VTAEQWNAVAAIAAAVGAGGALLSAVAALAAVHATRKAAEGNLTFQLLKDYAMPDMATALRTLRDWRVSEGDSFALTWARRMERGDAAARDVDAARRRVSSFFLDAVSLRDDGLLAEASYRRVVRVSGLAIFLAICVPLEREIDPAVNLVAAHRLRKEFPEMTTLTLRVFPASDRRT
jgi:hypothetical protein